MAKKKARVEISTTGLILTVVLVTKLVLHDRDFVDHHVVTFFDIVDPNFSILSDSVGFDLFALRVDVGDGLRESIMYRLAGAAA